MRPFALSRSNHVVLSAWAWFETPAARFDSPAGLAGLQGVRANVVPGTIAAETGLPAREASDYWYRTILEAPFAGQLIFEGLATLCEIWIDGDKRAESRSMFQPVAIDVDLARGAEIALAFRALGPQLAAAPKRSRWRPAMIAPNGLRHFRTTALGSMPGWCPPGRPVGPTRPVRMIARGGHAVSELDIAALDIRPSTDGEDGLLSVSLELKAGVSVPRMVSLQCGERSVELETGRTGRFEGEIRIARVRKWFPHTHGDPALYPVSLEIEGTRLDLGRTGFREITVDRGPDGKGFGLVINGVPVFCRGANWTNADIRALPCSREAYAPWLRLAREAGMNMLRVPGVSVYESPAFFDLCDEMGILVWQDMMFANFDYPQGDPAFLAAVGEEATAFLSANRLAPSLAVLCGGSEVFQQAAMLGQPLEAWGGPVFDTVLPEVLARLRPDVPYVPNSPSGGALPFLTNEGVSHYYGVGAYMRPLEDARRAEVRFATESLAFANIPEERSLFRAGIPPIPHHPEWKRGVPRDAGASWDFDDVRDHYLEALFRVSAMHLRRDDPERFLALSRAVVADLMETTFSEWRRPGSPTRGALVWFLQDLAPGAGWGVIGSDGNPKSAWYALKRAFRPLHLGITDEGVNGLNFHVVNDRPAPVVARLAFTAWRDGDVAVVHGARDLALEAHDAVTIPAFAMLEQFFDLTCAYRFGPPGHQVLHASLTDAATGEVLAEAFHRPDRTVFPRESIGLTARAVLKEGRWILDIASQRFGHFVQILPDCGRPDDNWFHLAPGSTRRIELLGLDGQVPAGEVRALNARETVTFAG
ncbi:MAG: glycoside hydrolase family 2 protein [Rhabdaerophilum sp.]